MNTHPEHWCIQATEQNFAELYPWWRANADKSWKIFTIGFTLMSSHPDGSYYFSDCIEDCIEQYPNHQPITLEQFRQITNPMNTLPTKWYIEVTEENQKELDRWRLKVATSHRDYTLRVGYTLLSEHHRDNSYYYSDDASEVKDHEDYAEYQPITLEQFRQITNSKPMSNPEVKTIQIHRTLLNEYYDAATTPQKEYMSKHFKLDGTTTDETIRGLYELACSKWKPIIKANHSECFPEESKYFDFSKHTNQSGSDSIVSNNVAESLGLCRNFIQVRVGSLSTYSDSSFYLHNDYNWELVKDEAAMVLIPTKKVK